MDVKATSRSVQHPAPSSKPKKRRESCDFCSLSKVRCDRGQPQCLRCNKSGVTCHYSESRRSGRIRQLYEGSYQSNGHIIQGTSSQAQPTPQEQEQKESNHLAKHAGILPYMQAGAHQPNGSADNTAPLELLEGTFYHAPELFLHSLNDPDHTGPHNNLSGSKRAGAHLSSPLLSTKPLPLEPELGDTERRNDMVMQETSIRGTALEPSTELGHLADCTSHALIVLRSLSMPGTTCPRLNSLSTRQEWTLDATLKNNRLATDTVAQILRCPCAQGLSLMLLLVLVTHEVMKSYHTLMVQQSTIHAPCTSPSYTSFSAFHPPMAIGQYHLDNEVRAKVILQVLWSEINKMDSLLDAFDQHVKGVYNQPEETILSTYVSLLQAYQHDIMQSSEKHISYV
ncbi:hypothetical protein ETB97_005474 [Aspergillus alliaceus]|uniref:Zn(2)-C6 fungal-type domain-containing protein n=1 Tax=Petromyces alliaceus TaxID=209559 RepID=A0A8H6A1G4_PETAA|nr:hypothetical protein ETB97_005474 [Aspergillus burnettii]